VIEQTAAEINSRSDSITVRPVSNCTKWNSYWGNRGSSVERESVGRNTLQFAVAGNVEAILAINNNGLESRTTIAAGAFFAAAAAKIAPSSIEVIGKNTTFPSLQCSPVAQRGAKSAYIKCAFESDSAVIIALSQSVLDIHQIILNRSIDPTWLFDCRNICLSPGFPPLLIRICESAIHSLIKKLIFAEKPEYT
jgi:hypothetical protein